MTVAMVVQTVTVARPPSVPSVTLTLVTVPVSRESGDRSVMPVWEVTGIIRRPDVRVSYLISRVERKTMVTQTF